MTVESRVPTTDEQQPACDPAEEHRMLADGARVVAEAAEAVERWESHAPRAEIDKAEQFLTQRFIPHLENARHLRERLAHRDHRCLEARAVADEIERLTAELRESTARLAQIDRDMPHELRRTLHRLRALVELHFHDVLPHTHGETER